MRGSGEPIDLALLIREITLQLTVGSMGESERGREHSLRLGHCVCFGLVACANFFSDRFCERDVPLDPLGFLNFLQARALGPVDRAMLLDRRTQVVPVGAKSSAVEGGVIES